MQTKHSARRILAASALALTLGGVMTTPAFAATTKPKSTKMAAKPKKAKKKAKAMTPAVVTTKKK